MSSRVWEIVIRVENEFTCVYGFRNRIRMGLDSILLENYDILNNVGSKESVSKRNKGRSCVTLVFKS